MKFYKKIVFTLAISFAGAALQAQVIDPLNGTGGISYTTYLVNDTSLGGGAGVSFDQSGSGLQESYVGTGTSPEQALSLAPASSFSTTFGVGDTLYLDSSVAASSTTEDFGLAISANNPIAGGPSDSPAYDSRSTFDWLSVSVRPSANPASVRVNVRNAATSSTVNTGSYYANPSLSSITGLYITWASGLTFNYGYLTAGNTQNQVNTVTFGAGSTIGSDIGFYGDLRAAGTSIGNFSNLSIASVPEPSTLAMCVMGLFGIATSLVRRKK